MSNVRDALRDAFDAVGASDVDTTSRPQRATRGDYVSQAPAPEVDPKAREYGEQLLAACRVAETFVDEGYESYSDWRSRTFAEHGQVQGAGKLIKLWRATRHKLA